MEFDKSRVYTAVDADELRAGDKVIVADDLATLKCCVKDNSPINIISIIGKEDCLFRFGVKDNCVSFAFAFLVERAEKHTDYNHCEEARKAYACAMTNVCPNKHYRPFKDTDELIEEWDKKLGYRDPTGLAKSYIWVRSKFNKDHKGCLITNFFGKYVLMNNQQCLLSRLFDEYTFLDGTPCGVEE